jgi:predicted esterase
MNRSIVPLTLLVPFCTALLACGSSNSGGSPSAVTVVKGGADAAAPGADAADVPAGPVPPLPAVTGTCPTFDNGTLTFTPGGQTRQAKVWIDTAAAAKHHGPLVLYWYGTGGSPDQVVQAVVSASPGIGADNVARITAAGGIVVAPVHVPVQGGVFPWLSSIPSDEAFADEIVACAKQQVGIDERHIHSLGFSAGGLFTAMLGVARSTYLASIVTYSGGGNFDSPADPNNKFPAMIVFGGANDQLVLNFHDESVRYHDALTQAGHFAFLCDHGGGHRIAADIQGSAVQFFFDHPYGQVTSPYEKGLPSSFPAYCSL